MRPVEDLLFFHPDEICNFEEQVEHVVNRHATWQINENFEEKEGECVRNAAVYTRMVLEGRPVKVETFLSRFQKHGIRDTRGENAVFVPEDLTSNDRKRYDSLVETRLKMIGVLGKIQNHVEKILG